MEGSVNLDIKKNIATIEFYHPQSNALPADILNSLAATITSCGINNQVKVIILKSKGDRAFLCWSIFSRIK